MARNQGWNIAGMLVGGAMLFTGGNQGWENMEQAEELRGRDSSVAETVIHFAGDQKHVLAEILGSNDGAPDPLDGALFLTDLELILSGVGFALTAKSISSLKK